MKTITKDTPVGTRVLVVDWERNILRTVTTSEVWRSSPHHKWFVSLAAFAKDLTAECVYLDEPEPGTWDWACRAALAGNTVRSKSAEAEFWYCEDTDAFVKRGPGERYKLEIANPSKAHVLATDWEVAE